MNIFDIQFPYYSADIKNAHIKGYLKLSQFIASIKHPLPKMLDIYQRIAKAELRRDMQAKQLLKTNYLYCFTPCVHINDKRCYNDITFFTGLAVLDFDHINNAVEFKQLLFKTFKFVVCVYLSPSRKGVKAICRIPICKSPDEFKEYFFGLAKFCKFEGFDMTAKNCVLPLFSSYDPNVFYRNDATIFPIKGVDPHPFIPVDTSNIQKVIPTERTRGYIIGNFEKAINRIVDNGHPQLRGACRALGGYIAYGYLTENEGMDMARQAVAQHSYFQKNVSLYTRTAKQFIIEGQRMPLKFGKR